MANDSEAIHTLLAAIGCSGFSGQFGPYVLIRNTDTISAGAANAVQSIGPVIYAAVLTITLVLNDLAIRHFLSASQD